MKRLSVFFVCIFLVSILSVNYHHLENGFFQNESFIFDTVDDNSDFSTYDIYQVFLNSRSIATIIIEKKLFTLPILTCRFSTRAPPA